MYKLKNSYIDRMVALKLSSKEIDFILFLAGMQDDGGTIHSVYYKDVCSTIHISVQKFYDLLEKLCHKGLLSYEKRNRVDYVVKLTDNDFSEKSFSIGYLKVGAMDFLSEKFTALKAGSKLLYLYMQRFIKGKHMLTRTFYSDFCKLFQRARKSIQAYIKELREKCLLFVSKKRNRAYHYEITFQNSSVLKLKEEYIPFEKSGYLSNLKQLIFRNYKKLLPENDPEGAVNDIVSLADTKRAERYDNFVFLIIRAIQISLEKQRLEAKKKPVLNAALINSCLSNILNAGTLLEQY